VQFATCPVVYQQAILVGLPHAAFDGASGIAVVCLALGPELFAVNAYRHYLRPENGDVFLGKPLSAAVRLSSMR
jgi:hypothetical protein